MDIFNGDKEPLIGFSEPKSQSDKVRTECETRRSTEGGCKLECYNPMRSVPLVVKCPR